jgi:hypothetical protein
MLMGESMRVTPVEKCCSAVIVIEGMCDCCGAALATSRCDSSKTGEGLPQWGRKTSNWKTFVGHRRVFAVDIDDEHSITLCILCSCMPYSYS